MRCAVPVPALTRKSGAASGDGNEWPNIPPNKMTRPADLSHFGTTYAVIYPMKPSGRSPGLLTRNDFLPGTASSSSISCPAPASIPGIDFEGSWWPELAATDTGRFRWEFKTRPHPFEDAIKHEETSHTAFEVCPYMLYSASHSTSITF